MAREKHWPKVGPFLFTVDGGTEGEIKVVDTCGLYVKQQIILKSDTNERVDLEIKRVLSRTELKVGRRGHKIDDFVDVSVFLTADNATIRADEQTIGQVPPEVIIQAKWAHEPINADRNILVDCYGDYFTRTNPVPVSPSPSLEGDIKCAIMGAPDVLKDYTWAEIDGVRRVTKICWTSTSINILYSITGKVTRDFTYDGADPFDLDKTEDTLTVA